MGKPGTNDVSIWDDAIFVWSKNGHFSFNANTDPSSYRPRVASLKPGTWYYRLGIHNLSKPKNRQYPALVQAAPVTVRRQGAEEETGWFGINIHRGGSLNSNSTHSLGCQTIPSENWGGFFNLVKTEMLRANIKQVPYVLVER
jgi:lysozyme